MNEPDELPPEASETTATSPATAAPAAEGRMAAAPSAGAPDLRPRPLIERIGMALIAVAAGAMFVLVSVAAFIGGEPFLGVMGAAGALMVLWVGGITLIRG